jgi:hypothetical protein
MRGMSPKTPNSSAASQGTCGDQFALRLYHRDKKRRGRMSALGPRAISTVCQTTPDIPRSRSRRLRTYANRVFERNQLFLRRVRSRRM